MKEVVEMLKKLHKTVSTMESCTGGGVMDAITSVEGASEVFFIGVATYSNDAKIKMGVDSKLIDQFSVYSPQVAMEMSQKVCEIMGADYGIGVTGKLSRPDPNNQFGNDNTVFFSIYDKENDIYYIFSLLVDKETRVLNKKMVIDAIAREFMKILAPKELEVEAGISLTK